MMDFISVPDWLLLSIRVCSLLIAILAVYNAVAALYLHLGAANIGYTLFLGVLSSMLFIDVSVLLEARLFANRVTLSAKLLGTIPTGVVIFFMAALAAGNGLLFFRLLRRRRNAITADTVKCTMDGMDDGICFFHENGETILSNIQMNRISSELFGSEILNGQLFWEQILTGKYQSGTLLKAEPAIFIRTADQRVWNMRLNKQYVENRPIYSVTAYDVSEQSRLYGEVRKRNAILSRMNQRLKAYNRAIKQVVADQETLAVKVRVHDDLGRVLLAARHVLTYPENGEAKKTLLDLWDEAVLVMKNESKPAVQKDRLDLLMQAAKSLCADIEIEGDLPEDRKARDLIIAAAHECLTNTVKHAGGDRLYLQIRDFDGYTQAAYRNNGRLPEGPIRESGGLGNLRKIVEQAGGTMDIEVNPQFILTVTVPGGEDSVWIKSE